MFILCTEFHTLPIPKMTSGTCSVLLQHIATFADLHINTVAVIPIFKTSAYFICVRVFSLQLCLPGAHEVRRASDVLELWPRIVADHHVGSGK